MLKNALHPASAMRLGEVVILDHVGRLQIFVIDRVVLAHQLQRRLVLEVLPLALTF